MPRDEDDPPTRPKLDAPIAALEAEARIRAAERTMTVATTPAPLEYAEMAALLGTIPRIVVDEDDLGEFRLDATAKVLLANINGVRSVSEIAARVDVPNVLSALTDLQRRGIIALKPVE